jgi:hypothetical protein
MRIHRLSISAILFAAACGGGHDVDPELISGGGITDPGIDGEVNIHVIDELTGDPIEAAEIQVGTVDGETDADGLFVAAGVSGPQTITVIASGHVATTWVGVNGANVTIPVGLPERDPDDVASGTITGTIEGFEDLPVPAEHARIALVTYTPRTTTTAISRTSSIRASRPATCARISAARRRAASRSRPAPARRSSTR